VREDAIDVILTIVVAAAILLGTYLWFIWIEQRQP